MSFTVDPLVRCVLECHPQTPCVAVREVAVEIGIEAPDVLVACFRILGDIERLRVPVAALDPDRLWEHTCCEVFVAPSASDRHVEHVEHAHYVEWNFSVTGQFARFEFSSYRRRTTTVVRVPARLSVVAQDRELQIEARAPLRPGVGDSARIALATVIEDDAGTLSYWAMRHPSDRPDFHHADGFALALTLDPSPAVVDDRVESP
jgi:hypothetical protein